MTVVDSWEHVGATKKKPAKPRKPEEVWYDVHKHPEGVPGGMGKSPEYHLRNRGWTPNVINGSTSKTIQYHNPKYPQFVISFGGATPTHPDHNFRILYLGDNSSAPIPRTTQAYQPAEAMDTVERLHQIHETHNGSVVRPMLHDSASKVPQTPVTPPPTPSPHQFVAPLAPKNPQVAAPTRRIGPALTPKNMFGTPDASEPEAEPNQDPQLQQIPEAPGPTQDGKFKRPVIMAKRDGRAGRFISPDWELASVRARRSGMDISPHEVRRDYPGLRKIVRDTWDG